MIERRFPHQVGKEIAKGINKGALLCLSPFL
jgi:hypothetical protein